MRKTMFQIVTPIFAGLYVCLICALIFIGLCGSSGCHTDYSRLAPKDPAAKAVETPYGLPGMSGRPDGTEGPNPAATWIEGKRQAEADFRATVKTVTWWIVATLAVIGVLMLAFSFFVAWASVKVSAYCLAGVGVTTAARYVLLTYGTLTADVLFWMAVLTAAVVALFVGIPLVHSWVKRGVWKRGEELAEAGKPREATVALAAASDEIDAKRKDVAVAIQSAIEGGGISGIRSLFRLLSRGDVPDPPSTPSAPVT